MQVYCPDSAATEQLGERLADHLQSGDVITLEAPLGGGKTTLIRGICRGLGLHEDEVSSPTFVLFHIHEARLPIYHFDLYRLNSPEELHPIGAEDYIWGNGVSLIEWPRLALSLLPPDRLEIEIEYAAEGRNIKLMGQGRWCERLVAFHSGWEMTRG